MGRGPGRSSSAVCLPMGVEQSTDSRAGKTKSLGSFWSSSKKI